MDDAAVEDVVSETLLTLWRKDLDAAADQSDEIRLRALAYKVLRGHISNEIRAHGRRRALISRAGAFASREVVPDVSGQRESRDTVEEWLGLMSTADREVLLLFNAGFDTHEMAEILDCAPSAAAKRRTRAKERLRRLLTESDGTRQEVAR